MVFAKRFVVSGSIRFQRQPVTEMFTNEKLSTCFGNSYVKNCLGLHRSNQTGRWGLAAKKGLRTNCGTVYEKFALNFAFHGRGDRFFDGLIVAQTCENDVCFGDSLFQASGDCRCPCRKLCAEVRRSLLCSVEDNEWLAKISFLDQVFAHALEHLNEVLSTHSGDGIYLPDPCCLARSAAPFSVDQIHVQT